MKKFVKTFAMTILLLACLVIILRCCMATNTSVLNDLYITDGITAAVKSGADTSELVKKVKVMDEISESGYFKAYALYYANDAQEAQITVRWNDSIEEYTDMSADTVFVFTLTNDTTGETSDSVTVDAQDVLMYNYRKLIFSDFTINDEDEVTITMNLRDGYTDTIKVKYSYTLPTDYKLSSAEIKQIG